MGHAYTCSLSDNMILGKSAARLSAASGRGPYSKEMTPLANKQRRKPKDNSYMSEFRKQIPQAQLCLNHTAKLPPNPGCWKLCDKKSSLFYAAKCLSNL